MAKKQGGSGFNIKDLVKGGGAAAPPKMPMMQGGGNAPIKKQKKNKGKSDDTMPMMKSQPASTPAPMMTYMGQ